MNKFKKIILFAFSAILIYAFLPPTETLAATSTLQLGVTKASAKTSYNMKVGEMMDLAFFGAKGYVYKTDGSTCQWTSSNPSVASVSAKGEVFAHTSGTATITMSVTVKATNTKYTGSVKITVEGLSSRLAAYNTYSIVYPSAADAEAAVKHGISLKRVNVTDGNVRLIDVRSADVKVNKIEKNVVDVIYSYSQGRSYYVYGDGIDEEGIYFIADWGLPDTLVLSYPDPQMNPNGGYDLTGKRSLKTDSVAPTLKMYDEDGILLAVCTDGKTFDGDSSCLGKLSYTKKAMTGYPTLNSSTGTANFTAFTQSLTAYATWTSTDKKTSITSNVVTIIPVEYEAPELDDWITGAALTNDKGNDIYWMDSIESEFYIPSGQKANLQFYFLASDDQKYSTFTAATQADDIIALDPKNYKYRFELGGYLDRNDPELKSYYNENRNILNLSSTTTSCSVQGLKPGTAVVELYQLAPGQASVTTASTLVGQIIVNVTEKAYLSYIELDENASFVVASSEDYIQEVHFNLYDQYGQYYDNATLSHFVFKPSGVKVSMTYDTDPETGATIKHSGTIKLDMSKLSSTQRNEGYIDFYYQKTTLNDQVDSTIYFTWVE